MHNKEHRQVVTAGLYYMQKLRGSVLRATIHSVVFVVPVAFPK